MEKVAVKSGYYFELFNKNELPETLIKVNYKVMLNNQVYDLYKGKSIEDARKIDIMFGGSMGYLIDNYIVKEEELEEEFEG